MSITSISQSNELGADVLESIFQQLDGKDLLNCEAVCRQWRDILLSGTPWRRLFHRQIGCSLLWRYVQKKLESNQLTLRTEQYPSVCKDILQVDRNWRTGNFSKLIYPLVYPAITYEFTIIDDYVAWINFRGFKNGECLSDCMFLDLETMEINKFPLPSNFAYLNEMVVFWRDRHRILEVLDPNNRWVINVFDEEANDSIFLEYLFGSKLLVAYTYNVNSGMERIRIWKMGNPPNLIHDRTFKKRNLTMVKVDERFIVATKCFYQVHKFRSLYFISTGTLEEHRSLSFMPHCKYAYDRGLLFQFRVDGVIRIMDVASGTFFNDVRMSFWKKPYPIMLRQRIGVNSNFLVIGWKYLNKKMMKMLSYLSVYDLEAIKNTNSNPDYYLLYTLEVEFDIESFLMDERRMICYGKNNQYKRNVIVIDFANFGLLSALKKKFREANENVDIRTIFHLSDDLYRCDDKSL